MLFRLMTALFACLIVGAAHAQNAPEAVDPETFQLRKASFAGKTVQLTGTIALSEEDFAVLGFDAGRLKHGSISFYPKDIGALWERVRLECHELFPGDKCKAQVIGIVVKDDDRVYLDKAEYRLLN